MALFIGSFNPPTLAHLEIAKKIKKDVSHIIFVPVNSNNKHLVSMEDRYHMLMIYQKKYSFIKIDDIMKNYSYFNYHILDLLNKKYQDNEIIIGSDILKKMIYFDNYEYLFEKYYFYVIKRDDDDVSDIISNHYDKYRNHFKIVNIKNSISSTLAREMIKNNEKLEKVLDKDIISYIRNKHLYF